MHDSTVADTLVDMLEGIGVKQIFALIGDSLNPLADTDAVFPNDGKVRVWADRGRVLDRGGVNTFPPTSPV